MKKTFVMFPAYFPMDTTKRCLVCLVFVVNCVTFGLICASMLTQEWVVVKPVRTGLNITIRNTEHSDGGQSTRFQGIIYFGLFDGKKVLNYGFGNRVFDLKIVCVSKLKSCMYSSKENSTERVRDLHDNFYVRNGDNSTDVAVGYGDGFTASLPDFDTWIVTVSSLSLAGMFAITGGAFAIVNAVRNSAELVFGFLGILIWNSFGILSGTVSILSWLVLYLSRLRKNALSREELSQHWVSEHRSCVGLSFYLVVVATVLFALNVALVAAIIRQPWVDRRLRAELRKKLSSAGKYAPPHHSPAASLTKKKKKGSSVISV